MTVEATDEAGAFYARATLRQLARLHDGRLPVGTVTDWPDLPQRGVMLDVSRDKVPTMTTLLALVDRLAEWKVNHLELYAEHTFAYRDHEIVWRDASPFTADEIVEQLRSLLPPVDQAAVTGQLGEEMAASLRWSVSTGSAPRSRSAARSSTV